MTPTNFKKLENLSLDERNELKRQEYLGQFRAFWEQKDREKPSSRLLNLCFKPMEPIDFCLFWVPKIWPYTELPESLDKKLPQGFRFASEVLLGWILDRNLEYAGTWLRYPEQCNALYKRHLRFVHIVWVIHFYTSFGFSENVASKLEKAFNPPPFVKP